MSSKKTNKTNFKPVIKFLKKRGVKTPILIVLTSILTAFLLILAFLLNYSNKIYPNIFIAGIEVGGLNKKSASEKILNKLNSDLELVAKYKDSEFVIEPDKYDLNYDLENSLNRALKTYKTDNYLYNLTNIAKLFRLKKEIGLDFNIDEESLTKDIVNEFERYEIEPIYPQAIIKDNQVTIQSGEIGKKLDLNNTLLTITQLISTNRSASFNVRFLDIDPRLNEKEFDDFSKRAEKYLGSGLSLYYGDFFVNLDDSDLLTYIKPDEINEGEIEKLVSRISDDLNQPPKNSVFVFENGVVEEFVASENGIEVQTSNLKTLITQNLSKIENGDEESINLKAVIPVTVTPPEITTDKVNSLGINELIGKGVSYFSGSIPSRIYNIGLAASKFKGSIVKPGDTFSFNKHLGDVSALTGYKQAYVIKDGQTILGDGGGVCQVSTTLFRAILDAGLPVVERRAHSYRVGYYEQGFPPGLDATVYDPSPDLKFKNDTPGHILLQTIFNEKARTLIFEIYGTNDGRIATTTKPKILSSTPPPEDLYIDDPSLPAGTIKQIDYKAWGARVTFEYSVEKDQEIIFQKTFTSNYQPWQAKFLRGTAPL